jgi:hypothetical protein
MAAVGFTAWRDGKPVSMLAEALLSNRYLRPYGTLPGHSPLRQAPLQSSFDSTAALVFRQEATTYQGFCPHRDIPAVRPPSAGVPKSPLRSVLRRSQPHDGLLRSAARELVSSHSRVQGSARSGVLPLYTATLPHREELPPCRCDEARSPTNRLPRAKPLDFEAFVHAESRAAGSAVKPCPRPLPSSGSSLLQVPSRPLFPVPQEQTLMTFLARVFDHANAITGPDQTPPAP